MNYSAYWIKPGRSAVWLAHSVRDAGVVGSNPTAPSDWEGPAGRLALSLRVPMYHVYALRSRRTGRLYVGSTQDVPERLRRHNAGHSKATKHGVPWVLVHEESFHTRAEAMAREKHLKTGRGREELHAISGPSL